VLVVFSGVQMVTMGYLGMMCRLFVIASLVMLGGFPMVLRRLFMMMSGFVVMLVDFVLRHFRLLPNLTVSQFLLMCMLCCKSRDTARAA